MKFDTPATTNPIDQLKIVGRPTDRIDGPLTPEQEKQVRFIEQNAREFSEMVDDLLDLAKVEAGRVEISPAWFEMVDLLTALRGMFKPMLTNEEVHLIFEEPPSDIPRLYTDDRKLSQVLRNFISNALKFTQRGEVRVSSHLAGDGWVTFRVAGNAPEEKLREVVERATQRSAVFDMVTNGVPVSVEQTPA